MYAATRNESQAKKQKLADRYLSEKNGQKELNLDAALVGVNSPDFGAQLSGRINYVLEFFMQQNDFTNLVRVFTTCQLDLLSLQEIGKKCIQLSVLDAKNTRLPVTALHYFSRSKVCFQVASVVFDGEAEATIMMAAIDSLQNVHELRLEDSMTRTQIQDLFVCSISNLKKVHVTGAMTSKDIEQIRRNSGLDTFIIDTLQFDLWHLTNWHSLKHVEIRERVDVCFYKRSFSCSVQQLSTLIIENAQMIGEWGLDQLLSNLKHMTCLTLKHSRALTVAHIKNAGLSGQLRHLNLTRTTCLCDELLSVLMEQKFHLASFIANYPLCSARFSEAKLLEFLNSPSIIGNLETLGVCYHFLTKQFFRQTIGCLSTLNEIDIRDCKNEVLQGLDSLVQSRRNLIGDQKVELAIKISVEQIGMLKQEELAFYKSEGITISGEPQQQ
jgi:hypothetical protein